MSGLPHDTRIETIAETPKIAYIIFAPTLGDDTALSIRPIPFETPAASKRKKGRHAGTLVTASYGRVRVGLVKHRLRPRKRHPRTGRRATRPGRPAAGPARRPRLGFRRRRGSDRRIQRACHRYWHGQIRPCRAQDRGDIRFHRHAQPFRAPGRGQPWRPGHDSRQ